MKKNSSNKIKLGIFVSLGLVVLILAIYYIGEKQLLFQSTFRLSGVFEDVAGLQPGNNVRLSGINIGTIESISLVSDTTVRVDIVIDESSRKFIKKDAIATIGSEGLIGNKVLVINPGTGGKKSIENNDVIQTAQPIDVDDIMISLKTTIDNTAIITGDLAKISTNIESGKGTIGRLMMDQTWRENIQSTIVNLKDGSEKFVVFMDKSQQIDNILLSINSNIDSTSAVIQDLSKIASKIQSGEGVVGKLLMDQSMGQNLDSTLINLKKGLAEFEIFMKMAQESWLLSF
ncbi:MAG: MCE family protein [Ignavibacteriales bacterium]|nr:MCE family protein [Ignavibacteriales bacterium]MBP9120501.1 MCE family protein [Ignavibacterium sp.]